MESIQMLNDYMIHEYKMAFYLITQIMVNFTGKAQHCRPSC